MKLIIKLLPPYSKKSEKNEYDLILPGDTADLRGLAEHLSHEWQDILQYPLFDRKNILTAEFMVNGKHQSLDYKIEDGDRVSVIPYICGG